MLQKFLHAEETNPFKLLKMEDLLNSSKRISDDLRYLIFSEIYQRYSEPKARRKSFSILENAIACFDKKGFENVTFQMIARESAITPPSLRHYFKNLEEIRTLSLQYCHLIAQNLIVKAMTNESEPRAMLEAYLRAHAEWARQLPNHIRVWLSFIAYSARKPKDRKLNTQAVINGANRLTELLTQGRESGAFHHLDDFKSARLIQTLILGWLIAVISEDSNEAETTNFSNSVIELCLAVVDA